MGRIDGSALQASKNSKSTGSFASSSTTFAVGGRPPNDPSDPQELADWAKSVAVLPMPVSNICGTQIQCICSEPSQQCHRDCL